MMFQRNMSLIDRAIRILIGVALLYVGFIDPGLIGIKSQVLGVVLGVLGLVNIGSAFMGHCPIYSIAGLSTCKKCDDNKE